MVSALAKAEASTVDARMIVTCGRILAHSSNAGELGLSDEGTTKDAGTEPLVGDLVRRVHGSLLCLGC